MSLLLLLTTTLLAAPEGRTPLGSWQDAKTVTARLADGQSTALLFFGSENCAYSGPARKAVELLLAEGRLTVPAAYLDINEEEGGALKERYHVGATPRIVVLRGATELWRFTASSDPEEFLRDLAEVTDGRVSWTTERARAARGGMGGEDLLAWAGRLQELGEDAERYRLLVSMSEDQFQHRATRAAAHAGLLLERAPEELPAGCKLHERVFGPDARTRINCAWAMLRGPTRTSRLIRFIGPTLHALLDDAAAPVDLRRSAAKFAGDVTVTRDLALAAWAMPLAIKGQGVNPRDANTLDRILTLALVTGDRAAEEAAIARFKAAYDFDTRSQETRERLEGMIQDGRETAVASVEWARKKQGR